MSEQAQEMIDTRSIDELPLHPKYHSALKELIKIGIYSPITHRLIVEHEFPEDILSSLAEAHTKGILTPERLNLISEYSNPMDLSEAFNSLHDINLLVPELIQALMDMDSYDFANTLYCLENLHKKQPITQHQLNQILSHDKPHELSSGFNNLAVTNISEPFYYELVSQHDEPIDLSNGFDYLNQNKLLSEENASLITRLREPQLYGVELCKLKLSKILSPEDIDLIIEQQNAESNNLIETLYKLLLNNVLTRENFSIILQHKNLIFFSQLISTLHDANLLTHRNIEIIIDENYAVLNTRAAFDILWYSIPSHLLHEHWDAILRASRQPEPLVALENLKNHILGLDIAANRFNHHQSTHTASIHRTIAESALRLMRRYQPTPEHLALNIHEINDYIDHLPSSLKHQAAKRAIMRLTQACYIFHEPISNISIQELIVLSFLAIKDDTHRIGTLDHALSLFIDGLYEIQRGYNLDSQEEDNLLSDSPICAAGSFNKIVEKLVGIHPDAHIEYLTQDLAMMKLPVVVKEEVIKYLMTQLSPATDKEYIAVKALLEKIDSEGLEDTIWANIQPIVTSRMQTEFGSLFKPKDFADFIANGIYTPLENLAQLNEQLQQSTGYQVWQRMNSAPSLHQSPDTFWKQENSDMSESASKKPKL